MANKKIIRILSLDGGGIRGLLSAHILAALEKKLNERWVRNNPGEKLEKPLRLANYFDMMAGTSTGGILSCVLLTPDSSDAKTPRYGAEDAVDLYKNNGKLIFQKTLAAKFPLVPAFRWAKFNTTKFEGILREKFGDTKLSELIRPTLITSYDIEKRRALFFTSQDAREKGSLYDFYLRDVARCTSAPTYFAPHRANSIDGLTTYSIDGGLFANNPTMCAVIEALKLFGTKSDETGEIELLNPTNMFILSVGTGTVKKPYFYNKAIRWGLLSWVAPIIDIMMSGVSETVDYQLRKLYSSMSKSKQYYRLMPQLYTADSEMDNVSDANIEALDQAGIQNAYDMDGQLDDIVDFLIAAGPVAEKN